MVNWEKNWRASGIVAALLFIVAYIFYGMQPKVGDATDELVSYYDGDSTRILIATVITGFGILNLMWFAAAIASVLRDAGKGGWGTAASSAGAAVAAVYFVLISLRAGLAYSIAGSGNSAVTSGLHDLTWVLTSLFWFPTAMLIMAGSFGLHRAGLISNRAFGAGVTAMVLVLLATTTWAGDGFWAVDGAYARFVPTTVMLVWFAVVSGFLVRRLSKESAPGAAPVPAA
jgi:magnesium-transporting ATPase (P-type)